MCSKWFWLLSCFCVFHVLNGSFLVSREDEKPIYSDKLGNCLVPDTLIEEIEQYQPIVERIVNEIVQGQYAGDTWLRYFLLNL